MGKAKGELMDRGELCETYQCNHCEELYRPDDLLETVDHGKLCVGCWWIWRNEWMEQFNANISVLLFDVMNVQAGGAK